MIQYVMYTDHTYSYAVVHDIHVLQHNSYAVVHDIQTATQSYRLVLLTVWPEFKHSFIVTKLYNHRLYYTVRYYGM